MECLQCVNYMQKISYWGYKEVRAILHVRAPQGCKHIPVKPERARGPQWGKHKEETN